MTYGLQHKFTTYHTRIKDAVRRVPRCVDRPNLFLVLGPIKAVRPIETT